MIAWDIETGPLARDELLRLYEPPKKPGEFNPVAVDLGRATKPETIAKKIAKAKAEHEYALANWDEVLDAHKADWLKETEEKAALDPLTGRVLAIGYQGEDDEQPSMFGSGDEAEDLEAFWQLYRTARQDTLVGHNIFGFDLPFVVRRSWLLDVTVPPMAFKRSGGRIYWDDLTFVDTMTLWTMGKYNEFVKLDVLAKAFGVEGKLEGVSGADFHKLWFGGAEQKAKAIEYLDQDVRVTMAVARAMGIV